MRMRKHCAIVVAGIACLWLSAAVHAGQAVYTDAVKSVPPLKGMMSPVRDLHVRDMEELAQWNVILIRYQITRNWGKENTDRDVAEYNSWLDGKLANLEDMLPHARRLGIRFVVDLHTPPGGRGKDNIMVMFDDDKYAKHFVDVWRNIAARFKDHPDRDAIWGYDLMNEPVLSRRATANRENDALFLRAAKAIRFVDPGAVIIVESPGWASPATFADMRPLPLENIIYQAHMYAPANFTHQFVIPEATPPIKGSNDLLPYPGPANGEHWDKERLRKELKPVRDFQERYGARIYLGEFSAVVWAPGADVYLRDCIELFDEYGWDWSYHSFREWEGWSLEHEGTPPSRFWPAKTNPRKTVMLEALKK